MSLPFPTDALLCFDTPRSRDLFRSYADPSHGSVATLEELVCNATLTSASRESDRVLHFEKSLSHSEMNLERVLSTIEALRQALVLSHDDVDFCFSALPHDLKNERLRRLCHTYLDSPLSHDLTEIAWQFIEQLKSGATPPSLPAHVVLISTMPRSTIFLEVATALRSAPAVESVTVKHIWELSNADTEGRRRNRPVITGSPSELFERISTRVGKFLHRGIQPSEIEVFFAGKPHERSYLEFCFEHLKIPYHSIGQGDNRASRESEDALLLRKIRSDSKKELSTRLRLNDIFLRHAAERRRHTPLAVHLERLRGSNVLTEGEFNYLLELLHASPFSWNEVGGSNGVTILPLLPLPPRDRIVRLVYVSDAFFSERGPELYFNDEELNLLFQNGFCIPRSKDYLAVKEETFVSFLQDQNGHTTVFSPRIPPFIRTPVPTRIAQRRNRTESGASKTLGDFDVSSSPHTLSATSLESFTRCPSVYFARHRMRLDDRSPLAPNAFALLFGQLAHRAFEKTLAPGSEVCRSELPDRLRLSFAAALEESHPTLERDHPLRTVLLEHFSRMARNVPQLEGRLEEIFGTLECVAVESSFLIALNGVSISAKIDRIARTKKGQLLIIDYKTGSVDFTPDHIVRGTHFQTLLYLLTIAEHWREPCVGMIFYDLKGGSLRRGLLLEDGLDPRAKHEFTRGHVLPAKAFNHLLAEGVETLNEISRQIWKGSFAPRPSDQHCATCAFASLCRQGYGYAD